MSNKITSEKIIKDIKEAVSLIAGDEYVVDLSITENSKLADDLELDSVEFTRVFEFILNKYEKAPIIEWISDMEISELLEMTVNDLTSFIQGYYE